jgi:hypothetical protein
MPSFFNRQYARPIEAVGHTEKMVGSVILILTLAVVAVFLVHAVTPPHRTLPPNATTPADTPASADSNGLSGTAGAPTSADASAATSFAAREASPDAFPEPGLAGWEAPARVFRYAPDTLHEKINGRAEVYLHYGVVGLTFGTYRHQTNAGRRVDVYWYRMTAPTGARAVYEAEAPPSMPPLDIGERAYRAGGAVFFQRGAHYVQVLPAGLDEASAEAAEHLARQLAERIGQVPTRP